MKIEISENSALVYTPYNAEFVNRIKSSIGGAKWDGTKKAWKIPVTAVEDVRAIMKEVYGESDEPEAVEKVNVRLTFECKVSEWCAPITIFGKTVASAFGRDSGAKVGDGVSFIEGKPTSGGSMKNWHTEIPAGCVCILYDVPKTIVTEDRLPDGVTFEIESRRPEIERNDLIAERERLLKRIAEIDAILASDQ